MATHLATSLPAAMQGQHTSGIFADMTVDGPEIGTLVAIVDRAKNLPNRKAMGKQNPYCAARLGKEAKKTETDRRGGQTPRWDQELRFTVHDSLDYHNLKLSVFSEDKKTDLIGEAWVSLDNVITPGGGKSDLWQSLSFKGKYAGELRIELTYYDSRPKPERKALVEEQKQMTADKVKRRPLPNNPNAQRSPLTPDTIPQPAFPGRARHGPRELAAPQRANSLPQEPAPFLPPAQHQPHTAQAYNSPTQISHSDTALPIPLHSEYEEAYTDSRYEDSYAQPDFLPSLPPAPRPHQQDRYMGAQSMTPGRPMQYFGMHHAHSDPVVPQHQDFYDEQEDAGLYTAAPEPLADLEYQHHYVQQRQRRSDAAPYHETQPRHYQHDYDHTPPPPPPTHSRSTSALPTPPSMREYNTPPSTRPISRGQQQHVSNNSPLQDIERSRFEAYTSPHARSPADVQRPQAHGNTPTQFRGSPGRAGYQHRNNMADMYASPNNRQSPHPLSQEVRARSPAPEHYHQTSPLHQPSPIDDDRYRMELSQNSITPIVKPRAISPSHQADQGRNERRQRSTYSIQNPIRAFESSDNSPLSTSRSRTSAHSTPRKSVSPHPSPAPSFAGGVPFGPDSFDIHNPASRHTADPDSPYDQGYNEGSKRTITAWDGREVDPSDHLPVASWAPEPEIKTPNKTYGLGRERDFGPRSAEPAGTRIGKDTRVNVRRRGESVDTTPSSTVRARLVKKNTASQPVTPLGEHTNFNPVPDPYAQQDYSRDFTNGSPGIAAGHKSSYDNGYSSYGPPDLPPKVPMGYGQGYEQDALSREIASIDIGSAPRQRAQAPAAYVPVRSHKDRHSFY